VGICFVYALCFLRATLLTAGTLLRGSKEWRITKPGLPARTSAYDFYSIQEVERECWSLGQVVINQRSQRQEAPYSQPWEAVLTVSACRRSSI